MKKIVKRVLMETLTDKKLRQAYVYLSNYMGTLNDIVDGNGDIILYEPGNRYTKFWIQKRTFICRVATSFYIKFSDEFSLNDTEIQFLISKWIEDTYQLKGFKILYAPLPPV